MVKTSLPAEALVEEVRVLADDLEQQEVSVRIERFDVE